MTKDKALHAWFSQFLPSYPTSNVPEDATFPWLTYELITGSWESGEIPLTVSLWYYTESEAMPNAKAQEISDAIGMGGCMVAYDGGAQCGSSVAPRGVRISRTKAIKTSSEGISTSR